RLDAGIGRALVAGAPGDRLAGRLEERRRPLGELLVVVANARQRAVAGDAAGKGNRRPLQLGLRHDLVDDPESVRLLGRDMAARGDRLERRLWPNETRQTLGPAGARQDADLHLG